ncbi:hypothetical protein GMRT_11099 [Giardia muris]|uniref:Uncharacterized protein n=1 Tax=Giardia muris TaxID=5742 RepID=A0A4Z1T367_GIAMU|nr:hypothetical protein GMRT_11099 [Giardia muris]|eukprot:TNJ30098.1 hypothetical protein GMRT_11099 [Giardia muris]
MSIKDLLLATTDPTRVQAAQGQLLAALARAETSSELFGIVIDTAAENNLRFLASIYLAQSLRNIGLREPQEIAAFLDAILPVFITFPRNVRRVLKEVVAHAVEAATKHDKNPTIYSRLVQMAAQAFAAANIDPSNVDTSLSLSPDLLYQLSDIVVLMLPYLKHATEVDLDDVLVLKLHSIIQDTFEFAYGITDLLVRCQASTCATKEGFAAMDELLEHQATFLLCMYTLEDLPTNYRERYSGIFRGVQVFLNLNAYPAAYVDIAPAVFTEARCALVSLLGQSIMRHFSDLRTYADEVVRLLVGVCAQCVGNTSPVHEQILTASLAELRALCMESELAKTFGDLGSTLITSIVIPSLRYNEVDFYNVETMNLQYLHRYVGVQDIGSRAAICESLLVSFCKLNPDNRGVVMQYVNDCFTNLGSITAETIDHHTMRCLILTYYSAAVKKTYSMARGISPPLAEGANLPGFYQSFVHGLLTQESFASSNDGSDAYPAKILLLCELCRFVADFRGVLEQAMFEEAFLSLLNFIQGTIWPFGLAVVANSVTLIIGYSKYSLSFAYSALWTLLDSLVCKTEADIGTNLILINSSISEYLFQMCTAISNLMASDVLIEKLFELCRRVTALTLPYIITKRYRIPAIFHCFELSITLLYLAQARISQGVTPQSPQLTEEVRQTLTLIAGMRNAVLETEDWAPHYYQLVAPVFPLAAALGLLDNCEALQVILQDIVSMTSVSILEAIPALALAGASFIRASSKYQGEFLQQYYGRLRVEALTLCGTDTFRQYGFMLLTALTLYVPTAIMADSTTIAMIHKMVGEHLDEIRESLDTLKSIARFFICYAYMCDPSVLSSPLVHTEILMTLLDRIILRDPICADLTIILVELFNAGKIPSDAVNQMKYLLGVSARLTRRRPTVIQGTRKTETTQETSTKTPLHFAEFKILRTLAPRIEVPPNFNPQTYTQTNLKVPLTFTS